jgi:hypothetical protein
MRALLAASVFAMLVQGCDRPEPGESRGSTTPRYERTSPDLALEQSVRPVRIGELGPNFAACNTVATTRDRAAGAEATLIVRTAPFEAAPGTDRLPAGASFFVCSRSLDQRWFGIVYETGGTAAEICGVSRPVPARRDYDGPCRSGWVSSALVKLVGR